MQRFNLALFALAYMTLACRPVLAVGAGELLVIIVLAGLFFGLSFLRFLLRRIRDEKKKSDH